MPVLDASPAASFAQAVAGVCTILLRDLGGAEVREQQYVAERREPTELPKGVPMPGSRGRLPAREVVGYLPRRVHVARERTAERGSRQRPRAHAVAAHLMRLRDGAHASADAAAYAARIGLPLMDGYTVREAHVKGGTAEERAALEVEVRRWRSWSALDYLRALMRPASERSAPSGRLA